MGNFAENLNLGNRFRPPLVPTNGSYEHLSETPPWSHTTQYRCGYCKLEYL